MATRKEVYSQLEALEGGEAIKDALKELFQADDKKLSEVNEELGSYKKELGEVKGSFEELKNSSQNTVSKTEMEKTVSEMQKTLEAITKERDEAKKASEQAIIDKKNGELNRFFSNAVLDSFGSKNAEMSVGFAMANGDISYNDSGEMGYKGKVGEEALELFKSDNVHLVQNKGTGTTGGGDASSTQSSYVQELREQMMR